MGNTKAGVLPKPKLIYPMKCLRCDKSFLSWHKAKNRLCSLCQGGSVYIRNGATA